MQLTFVNPCQSSELNSLAQSQLRMQKQLHAIAREQHAYVGGRIELLTKLKRERARDLAAQKALGELRMSSALMQAENQHQMRMIPLEQKLERLVNALNSVDSTHASTVRTLTVELDALVKRVRTTAEAPPDPAAEAKRQQQLDARLKYAMEQEAEMARNRQRVLLDEAAEQMARNEERSKQKLASFQQEQLDRIQQQNEEQVRHVVLAHQQSLAAAEQELRDELTSKYNKQLDERKRFLYQQFDEGQQAERAEMRKQLRRALENAETLKETTHAQLLAKARGGPPGGRGSRCFGRCLGG